jgi:hypothetical protein
MDAICEWVYLSIAADIYQNFSTYIRSKKSHNNLLEFLKPSGLSRFHAKVEKENKSLEGKF